MFSRIFAVGFFMAGVAAIYTIYFHETSDATYFFLDASAQGRNLFLKTLVSIREGALAVIVWNKFYDIFTFLGFSRSQFIGVTFNVTIVALTGVIAVKIARHVYGNDPYRFKRLTLLMSASGLLWLFAATHLRDSLILFVVTVLVYSWVLFLKKHDSGMRLFQVIAFSMLICLFIGFLRREFVFVPVAMAMAGLGSLLIGKKLGRNQISFYFLVIIGLVGLIIWASFFGDSIQYAFIRGNEGYAEALALKHSGDSLGMALIVNQPLPIRLVIGSIYLFVYPIPFWSGFQIESAYHLFKSFNVIFFYFVIPLLVMTLWQLWGQKEKPTSEILFCLFTTLGFTVAIAGTSLETRHLGVFLVPIFITALLPDLRVDSVWNKYKQLLTIFILSVVLVHIIWLVLKM
jgi:hypothetical protein